MKPTKAKNAKPKKRDHPTTKAPNGKGSKRKAAAKEKARKTNAKSSDPPKKSKQACLLAVVSSCHLRKPHEHIPV